MPIYEYQCRQCGETTEAMQKFSDAPLKKCPACGGRLTKLMSMNSFQLKGSGWYVTDYAGRKGEGASKGEAAAKPAAESKAAGGQEAAAPKAKAKKEGPAKA